MLRGPLIAPLHERADGRRRGVENRHAVALADVPEAVLFRPVRCALVHQHRRAIRQRPVNDIRMAGNPTDVRGAPEDVVVLEIEHPLGGGVRLGEVAAGGVQDALRFARRPRGVEDVQRILGVHRLGRARVARRFHQVVPPLIAATFHLHVFPCTS